MIQLTEVKNYIEITINCQPTELLKLFLLLDSKNYIFWSLGCNWTIVCNLAQDKIVRKLRGHVLLLLGSVADEVWLG